MRVTGSGISIVLIGLCTSATAFAQAQIVPSDANKGADKSDIDGWAPFLTLTSTIAMADNSNTVGQVDGFSTLFGLGVKGGADYVHGPHLLRTALTINEGFAKTPVVKSWIKTNDVATLEGIYNYFATPIFGGFGRLTLTTSLFGTEDVKGTETQWVLENADKTLTPLNTGFHQHLDDAFAPFTINESVGGFWDPIKRDEVNLSVRVGLGGRHTFADGDYSVDGSYASPAGAEYPQVGLLELHDVQQLGVEAFAGGNGKLDNGKTTYLAGLSVLFPFVNNDSYNRTAAYLTRIALQGQVTFNMYSWLSLVYNLSVIRDPELFAAGQEKVQVQNTLLLTFQLSIVKKKVKPAEPTKEQIELKAAQDRADAAEKKAADCEAQLKSIQGTAPPTPGTTTTTTIAPTLTPGSPTDAAPPPTGGTTTTTVPPTK